MKLITNPQLQKLHILLRSLDWLDDKKEIIAYFTNNRTESSRDLSYYEAKDLISQLAKKDPVEMLRDAIFKAAYTSGITYGSTREDHKINLAKINMFCRERGTVKKDLYKQTHSELLKTLKQFKAIIKNNINRENKATTCKAQKAVSELLSEMGIDAVI
ncbi:hypothetical protein ACR79B_02515 [Sphingobacterium spiritivorum]|uniref:hypothetical protein n=1 Tax=Sphingobacterium spiritivorum TaxID=258 RepID=UPI003DA271B6